MFGCLQRLGVISGCLAECPAILFCRLAGISKNICENLPQSASELFFLIYSVWDCDFVCLVGRRIILHWRRCQVFFGKLLLKLKNNPLAYALCVYVPGSCPALLYFAPLCFALHADAHSELNMVMNQRCRLADFVAIGQSQTGFPLVSSRHQSPSARCQKKSLICQDVELFLDNSCLSESSSTLQYICCCNGKALPL